MWFRMKLMDWKKLNKINLNKELEKYKVMEKKTNFLKN